MRDHLALVHTRLLHIFFECNSAHLAGISGAGAFFWGLWILMPHDTFPTSISYNVMASLAPEWVWGLVVMVVGAAQIATTLSTRGWKLRASANFATFVTWVFIATMFIVSNWLSTATVIYPLLAAVAFGSFFRRLQDQGSS